MLDCPANISEICQSLEDTEKDMDDAVEVFAILAKFQDQQ
jgi:hypothetical protein